MTSMKILVMGDSHGNIANLKHVMGFGKHTKVSAVIHTGDWNNLKSVETVLKYSIPLYSCLGNGDIDPNFEFKELVEFEIDNVKIGAIHNIKKLEENGKKYDAIFCGHTHKQGQVGNVVNPGALENGINFAVFDTKTKVVEFVHD